MWLQGVIRERHYKFVERWVLLQHPNCMMARKCRGGRRASAKAPHTIVCCCAHATGSNAAIFLTLCTYSVRIRHLIILSLRTFSLRHALISAIHRKLIIIYSH